MFFQPIQRISPRQSPSNRGRNRPNRPEAHINEKAWYSHILNHINQIQLSYRVKLIITLIISTTVFLFVPSQYVQSCTPSGDPKCINGYLYCELLYQLEIHNGVQRCVPSKQLHLKAQTVFKQILQEKRLELGEKICLETIQEVDYTLNIDPVLNSLKEDIQQNILGLFADGKMQNEYKFSYNNDHTIKIDRGSESIPYICQVKLYIIANRIIALILVFCSPILLYFYYLYHLSSKKKRLASKIFKDWKQMLMESEDQTLDLTQAKKKTQLEYDEDDLNDDVWDEVEKIRARFGKKIFLGPGYWIMN